MINKKISVIIPTFERNITLKRAIKSILNQTFMEFEVIIINDSHNEKETLDIIKKFNDKRIKYFRNSRQKGANGARNTGILKSKGKYIAMMDDDDLAYKNRLKKQLEIFEKDRSVDVVSSFADIIDDEGKIIGGYSEMLKPEDFFFLLNFKNCIVHSSVMFRKDLFLRSGGYNESLSEAQDFEFWTKLSKKARFYQIYEKLTAWREHKNSITGIRSQEQEETVINIVKENLNILTGRNFLRKEIILLRKFRIENLRELKRVIILIEFIKKMILLNEKESIKNLDLNIGLLKKAADKRIAHILYFFFTENKTWKYPFYFIYLPFSGKKILLKKIMERLSKIFKPG